MVSRVIPVDPFDLVIFGGTGDLARRKILPGLYRRFTAGQMPPEARVIGAARGEMSVDDYRRTVGEAIAEFVPERHRTPETVAAFLDRLGYVRIDATGDRRLGRPRPHHGPRRRPRLLLLGGTLALRRHRRTPPRARHRRPEVPDRRREALRPRPRLRPRPQPHAGEVLRRGADLPDRPLSGQGDRPEPHGGPLRQHPVRAALERPLRRPHPDHGGRVRRRRRPRQLLRRLRRHARHGAEPHDAAPLPHRDGAALEVRPRRRPGREAEGHPRAPARRSRRHRPRPVRGRGRAGLLPRGRGQRGEQDRKLHRHEGRHRQLALERHALLPPHGQAHEGPRLRDRRALQGAAAFDLRRATPATTRTNSPSASSPTKAWTSA